MHFEKQLSSEYIFKGKVVNLRVDKVLLENGKTATREIVEHNGGVCIVAMTDQNEVLMVEQYRHPYGIVVCECPAGKLEKGEDPLKCAIRELKEETGVTAKTITSLGMIYPSPGCFSEILHLYLAKGLSFGETNLDEDEFLTLKKIPLRLAVEMVMNNTIKDAKTCVGVLKAGFLNAQDKK